MRDDLIDEGGPCPKLDWKAKLLEPDDLRAAEVHTVEPMPDRSNNIDSNGVAWQPTLSNNSIGSQPTTTEDVDGGVGCITPSGRYFHTRRCRLLLPEEKMALQGIWFGDEEHDNNNGTEY